ncbi:VWA domain-containing protein, partial [Acinetobacter baumannii]|uniref:vWA domain-containing protein n=1 Tax=Acinetobacter baumannii TaxID=470 RepID=UPI00189B8ECF
TLSAHEIAIRYYRERALPHLVSFPTREAPEAPEPQLEGLEPWEIGDPLDEVDWLQSVSISPIPVPGLTTVRRTYGRDTGVERDRVPVDLDMYVDSSGSMPNPQVATSYLALAGAIIALSALRAEASVQVTLWSGKSQVLETKGFVRDSDAVLGVLTGFFGGGTCFPIHRLRETYAAG